MQAFATTGKERLAFPVELVVKQYPSLKPAVLIVCIQSTKSDGKMSVSTEKINNLKLASLLCCSTHQFPAVVPNDAKMILSMVLFPVQPTVRFWPS